MKILFSRPKSSIFQLQGGLGNQLFIYFAGMYYQDQTGSEVFFDISRRDKGITNHGSTIESLGFDLHLGKISQTLSGVLRVQNSLQIRGIPGHTIIKRFLRSKIWLSSEIGYSGDLLDIPLGAYASGYFQSYKYLDSVTQGMPTIPKAEEILNKSELIELTQRAMAESPIIVHVRRGDYLKVKETFGLLSGSYYKNAIKLAQEINPHSPIWVFSDDLEAAKKVIKFSPSQEIEFISVPGNNAAATLLLMSLGVGHVLSNSTFAWWGSYFSGSSEFTIAPQKWFKNLNDPQNLYPPDWLLVRSEWE
jgi:hypothetical protein